MEATYEGRFERHAPIVAGLLIAAPTLLAHYLPMTDLPLHEGAVGLLRHFGDDSFVPPNLYRLNLGHPNQLFYALAWALSYLVGTVWAVKLVVAAGQLAVFATGARLADHMGRSRWAALLLAPLALGFTFFWGLTANLLGFAALLGALPVIDRAAARPTPRGAAASCGVLLVAFFAHESAFMAATGFVLLLALAHPFERRDTLLRLAPVAFGVAVAIAHQIYAAQFFTGVVTVAPMQFPAPWTRIAVLPAILFGSHDEPVRYALLALGLGAGGLMLRARRASEPPAESASTADTQARVRAFALSRRYELLALVFVVLYFVMPFNFRGATMLWQRFLGPAWALLVLCAAPRGEPPRLAKVLAGVLPVAVLLVAWPQFADADRTSRDLDAIVAEVPKNSAVALVVVERPVVATRIYSASVMAARMVADRGGRFGLSLAMSPFAPVQVRPEYRWDEYERRTVLGELGSLQPAHDLDRFGWVIAQSPATMGGRALLIVALEPDAELVMERGEWLLFRSTHPQAPLASAEGAPAPGAQSLRDRMAHIARRRGRSDAGPP